MKKNRILLAVVALALTGAYFFEKQEPKPKACKTDGDCVLRMCTGCFSALYLQVKNPAEPPCAKFNPQVTTCGCQQNICTEKSK